MSRAWPDMLRRYLDAPHESKRPYCENEGEAIPDRPGRTRVPRRPLRMGLPSVARWTCQAPYDRAQHGLPYRFGCFFDREPFHLTLPPFRPLLPLSLYPQRVNVHFTDHNAAVLKALFVWKRSNGTSADRSNNTGFFKSFARSRMMGRLALLRPTFGDDPASRPS